MKNYELPIPIYQIALLQAYLYQTFKIENQCSKNFDHTKWYLLDNYNEEEVYSIIDFFISNGVKCDCDLLSKFDLREMSKNILNPAVDKDSLILTD